VNKVCHDCGVCETCDPPIIPCDCDTCGCDKCFPTDGKCGVCETCDPPIIPCDCETCGCDECFPTDGKCGVCETCKPTSEFFIELTSGAAIRIDENPETNVGKYITASENKTVADIRAALSIPANHTVTFSNDEGLLGDSDIVGTGTIIRLYFDGTLVDSVTIIVLGDTTGSGKVLAADYARIEQHLLGVITLESSQLLAAKTFDPSHVFAADHARIRQHIWGIINLHDNADI